MKNEIGFWIAIGMSLVVVAYSFVHFGMEMKLWTIL